jgi:hypothetical protein
MMQYPDGVAADEHLRPLLVVAAHFLFLSDGARSTSILPVVPPSVGCAGVAGSADCG